MSLIEVRHLVKHFSRSGGLFQPSTTIRAVDDVSFSIEAGEMFGLVGESGSGKSTTGRCLLRLIEPTAGEILFKGENVLALPPKRLRRMRRHMQIVFQDPYGSLNPRMRAGDIVREPLVIHNIGTHSERRARVEELFDLVGLDQSHMRRYPREFSGGQRQRISIARALALNPSFVVADEAVSSLDMSIQAQIVRLLMDLRSRLHLTVLFITHDLRLVEHICNRVAVMYRGKLVEMGETDLLFAKPAHSYTRALLSAVPSLNPDTPRRRAAFDETMFRPAAPMKEIEPEHWAAV
jgi:ABC-type oligopeptide transport system ATPase subunit